ncbi:restriction endonuclease [Shewanella aestuarii]|uniref:Restriction endonuclease n=1 Tax=Shewanella aestuarii TaxID=1028752 RepID=A0A6G9QPZ9_9GAMM|nr:restriction endonuclease [Shewanella aestuarii]QIR16498.1 restriction endonuclease [Shewanella aestuarii]
MSIDFSESLDAFVYVLNQSILSIVSPFFNHYIPALSYSTYLPITYLSVLLMMGTIYLKFDISKDKRWRIESSKSALSKLKGFESPAQVFAYLRRMDPFTFEELLLTSINRNSFVKIERNSKYTGDGGIDGRFYINGKLFLIQAKRYKGYVKTADIEYLHEKALELNAAGALFVHTGKTRSVAFSKYTNGKIFIVSGHAMCTLIQKGKLPRDLLKLAQPNEA